LRISKFKTRLSVTSACLLLGVAAGSGVAQGQAAEPTDEIPIELSGFLRVDYGAGDRYDGVSGSDRFGVSKAALAGTATFENTSATLVLGTGDLSGNTAGDFNGDVFVADAFITSKNVGGTKWTLSAGLRPILFGLKPNGFPGDRSLQGSIEYGGAGQFAVSNQAGAAVVATYPIFEGVTFEAGLFDSDAGQLAPPDGSNIVDNNFAQVRFANIAGSNFYGVLGAERRYVGATNSSEPILDAGIGWAQGMFDISAEYVSLDQAITGTPGDESYIIIEGSVSPWDNVKFYADWAQAEEADINTARLGGVFGINRMLNFQLEYSRDDGPLSDTDSVDARIAADF
jgi:hypothetical protein